MSNTLTRRDALVLGVGGLAAVPPGGTAAAQVGPERHGMSAFADYKGRNDADREVID